MKAFWNYFKYVCRHKWFVFWACRELKVPLHIALLHDCTKLTPGEMFPYVSQFFNPDGSDREIRDATGAYDPTAQSDSFKHAWLKHQKNKHHWQAWVLVSDSGSLIPLEMPDIYIKEMVADWVGAGKAQKRRGPVVWYAANKDKLILHPKTREKVESILDIICQ